MTEIFSDKVNKAVKMIASLHLKSVRNSRKTMAFALYGCTEYRMSPPIRSTADVRESLQVYSTHCQNVLNLKAEAIADGQIRCLDFYAQKDNRRIRRLEAAELEFV